MTTLVTAARALLQPLPDVSHLVSLRRSTSLFTQGQTADSMYLIENGLVKLTRTNGSGGRIILGIFGLGQVVGEEILDEDENPTYFAEADVLTTATVWRVPLKALTQALAANIELGQALTSAIIRQKRTLAEKVELLCLRDVEYRILHYLAELAPLVAPIPDGEGYQLPITQLELADLIGATRETTSTTLNQLERRGLVKLSRRLLTIPSPMILREAASARGASDNRSLVNSSVSI